MWALRVGNNHQEILITSVRLNLNKLFSIPLANYSVPRSLSGLNTGWPSILLCPGLPWFQHGKSCVPGDPLSPREAPELTIPEPLCVSLSHSLRTEHGGDGDEFISFQLVLFYFEGSFSSVSVFLFCRQINKDLLRYYGYIFFLFINVLLILDASLCPFNDLSTHTWLMNSWVSCIILDRSIVNPGGSYKDRMGL